VWYRFCGAFATVLKSKALTEVFGDIDVVADRHLDIVDESIAADKEA
jgi:hypothetical protein